MNSSSKKLLENYVCSKVKNEIVCDAFKKIDRKFFVPEKWTDHTYLDEAISLDRGSSISQPSLVAQMIDLLDLDGKEHVLEVGTASGYSAAVLSLCCQKVDTIEIDPALAESARKRLKKLGFPNIEVHQGDGSLGLPGVPPFDGIIVTAATAEIPKALIDQLKNGGKIVIPLETEDSEWQELIVGQKLKGRLMTKAITQVRFVPLV